MSRNHAADKKKLLQRLVKTPIVEVACTQANVPRSTYYRWRKSDPAFADACDEALEESNGRINDLAESQLIAAIKDQNMTAITFWLRHHHKMYEPRIKVDASVRNESQELSAEQAELVSQALKYAGLLAENETS